MISIKRPYIENENGKSRLCAEIAIAPEIYEKWKKQIGSRREYAGYEKAYSYGKDKFQLWYEVEDRSEQILCQERTDAFVVAVLYFAMVTGEDIEYEGVLSNELYHNLNTNLIPMHCNERSGLKPIRIIGRTESRKIESLDKNGTGVSRGVDSFDTIFTYLAENMDAEHRLNCLTVFNVGSYNNMPDLRARKTGMMTLDEYNEKAENFFSQDVEKGRQIAKELGTDFIAVNSNINSLYQGVFLELHGYSNSSAVLAVQKLFSHYYYSSAGEPEKARWGVEEDASDNVQFFSTESLQFYLARENVTRIEKIQHISQHETGRKRLHVCCDETENCGKCGKCFRTLLILELIGKQPEFKESFKDTSAYEKKGWKKYVWILDKKDQDFFAKDIYEYIKREKMKIPMIAKAYHYTLPVRKVIHAIRGDWKG